MAEWLIEDGIGEQRALLLEGDDVLAAKLYWPGELHAGFECEARLAVKPAGTRRGLANLENGTEILVDHLPADLTEGQVIGIRIMRAPMSERGRFKRALGRFVSTEPIADTVNMHLPEGRVVRHCPAGLWEEVWEAASSGIIEFSSGQILASPTPAMTLIDVDGPDDAKSTANAAVPAIARAIRWFDIGGSVGIDFPTIETKADRRAVDEALGSAMAGWPHERTAMNGFGFVQIVARLEGPSFLHRFSASRTGMCARFALRCAERAEGAGPFLLLTVHPALKAKLKPEWLEELARRTGKQLRIETDPGIALEAPNAQVLAHE